MAVYILLVLNATWINKYNPLPYSDIGECTAPFV